MEEKALFIDGSVDPKSNVGVGAYLLTDKAFTEDCGLPDIRVKRFEGTSSTKLELQTLLWAFEEIDAKCCGLKVYTDSQNIVGLPDRRAKLQECGFQNRNGQPIRNRELYQRFYDILASRNCCFEKVEGHQAQSKKSRIEEIFTQVDRAARAELRKTVAAERGRSRPSID